MAFTLVQFKKFVQIAIATAQTTQYTVPAASQDVIKCIDIANTTGAAITVTVNLVPSAGVAGTGNVLFNAVTIAANSTLHWTGTQVMNTGDFISTAASAVGCTINVSGLEST